MNMFQKRYNEKLQIQELESHLALHCPKVNGQKLKMSELLVIITEFGNRTNEPRGLVLKVLREAALKTIARDTFDLPTTWPMRFIITKSEAADTKEQLELEKTLNDSPFLFNPHSKVDQLKKRADKWDEIQKRHPDRKADDKKYKVDASAFDSVVAFGWQIALHFAFKTSMNALAAGQKYDGYYHRPTGLMSYIRGLFRPEPRVQATLGVLLAVLLLVFGYTVAQIRESNSKIRPVVEASGMQSFFILCDCSENHKIGLSCKKGSMLEKEVFDKVVADKSCEGPIRLPDSVLNSIPKKFRGLEKNGEVFKKGEANWVFE